jgi:tetratricopeptide (TPR) repeat protein
LIASEELRTLVNEWRAPARKGKLFGKKAKSAALRLEAARRLAQLASDAPIDDELIEALERACGEFADDRPIRRAYARALAGAGRVGEAIGEFEERLQSNADDAEDLADVADLYERAGRIDLAVDRLRRAVDLQVAAKDIDAAVRSARRLIVLEPESLETASDLVSILRSRDPGLLAEGVEHLADVYRDRGKVGQEADACRELLALSPDREDVRHRLSGIYTRILEVDPDDQEAWLGLASIDEPLADQLRVLLANDEPPAQSASTSGATPAANHAAYASRKAQELMDAGDMVGASLCLERAVQTDPDPQAHLRLARCYAALHREAEAAREGLRALALAQVADDPQASDESIEWLAALAPPARGPLADAVFLNHRPESADILYEALLQLWDDTAKTTHRLGASEQPD